MKIIMLVASLLMGFNAWGANISWNHFQQEEMFGATVINRPGYEYEGEGEWALASAGVGIRTSVSPDGSITLVGENLPGHMTYCCLWAKLDFGAIVSDETMSGRSDYFMAADSTKPDGFFISNPITMSDPGNIYLAVLQDTSWTGGGPGANYLGWVEIEVSADGEVRLVQDAFRLDHGPLIVGGGAAEGGGAIPEPTSAMLVLVGAGLLGLRRRKRTT